MSRPFPWGEGTVLFQGGAGNAPLVQLAPLPFGFVAVGNMEIKMWEHKAMGSQLTSDPTGSRWGAVIGSDLTPSFVKSVVTWPDPCSVVCGFVVAAGWTIPPPPPVLNGHVSSFPPY